MAPGGTLIGMIVMWSTTLDVCVCVCVPISTSIRTGGVVDELNAIQHELVSSIVLLETCMVWTPHRNSTPSATLFMYQIVLFDVNFWRVVGERRVRSCCTWSNTEELATIVSSFLLRRRGLAPSFHEFYMATQNTCVSAINIWSCHCFVVRLVFPGALFYEHSQLKRSDAFYTL